MPLSRRRLLTGAAAVIGSAALPLRSLGLLFPSAAFAAPGSASGTEALSLARFRPLVGSTFQAVVGAARTNLRLATAAEGQKCSSRGECFSLRFDGPAGAQFPQGTYTFTHPSLGSFPLFVVPAGPTQASPSYEAVFNRV